MNIEPLYSQVLIKPFETEIKSVGGVTIPQASQEKQCKGEVIAVGNGTKERDMNVIVGKTAFYIKGAGTRITEEGVEYLLMMDKDVLAHV